MRRLVSALVAAVDAAAIFVLGLGSILAVGTALWVGQWGFSPDYHAVYQSSAVIWLLGHGVDVAITVDAGLAGSLGLSGADSAFPVTTGIPFFALISGYLAYRAGRRAALADSPRVALVTLVSVMAMLAVTVALSARSQVALPGRVQGVALPLLIMAIPALVGFTLEQRSLTGTSGFDQFRTAWLPGRTWPALWRRDLVDALRAAVGATMGTVGLAALSLAILTVLNYANVIGLYQALHPGLFGGIVLTLAQIALAPNLVVWAASYLVGPGFSLGAGSIVSPAQTLASGIPGLPLFGAVPHISTGWGYAVLLAPTFAAFFAAARVRAVSDRFSSSANLVVIGRVALATALAAGGLLAALAWFSSGAIGPGSLAHFGAAPLPVFIWSTVEFAVGSLLGGLAGRALRRH